MSFKTTAYLRKATTRAKSDVANKLVSMFLHEVSRKVTASTGLSVADSAYSEAVEASFGAMCCYCGRQLEEDRTAIEHLDGMNRFRAGLHTPGNMIVSCKKCNNEKRRDDQLRNLVLAESGWESFLSHNGTNCSSECRTCKYWKATWPDSELRSMKLKAARKRIRDFRCRYEEQISLNNQIKPVLHNELERLYRDCQSFAESQIKAAVTKVTSSVEP